jgi:hypothetical protein
MFMNLPKTKNSMNWITLHNLFNTEVLCNILQNASFLQGGAVNYHLISKLEENLYVNCPKQLIRYICSYPPYLEAVFPVCNLRTYHAIMTRDPLNILRMFIFMFPLDTYITLQFQLVVSITVKANV